MYLSISELDPKNVIYLQKWVEDKEDPTMLRGHRIIGYSIDGVNYHKYCGFNKFCIESAPIPSGWQSHSEYIKADYDPEEFPDYEAYKTRRDKWHREWINKYVCDPSAAIFVPNPSANPYNLHPNFLTYKTLDNYDTGFIVFVDSSNKYIHVYGHTKDVVDGEYDTTELYDRLVLRINYLDIWIGESHPNAMTKFSGGHGSQFNGNSILIRVDPSIIPSDIYNYISFGSEIYSFTTEEPIHTYVSSVGNNCVPYPYARTDNWLYDIIFRKRVPVSEHPNIIEDGHIVWDNIVTSYPMDCVDIDGRVGEIAKSSADTDTITGLVKFTTQMECKFMANTCSDTTLPAVNMMLESRTG